MYDAIVIGARCAGAPTAMLLARKGMRVLLADRATFPSDTISTHYIHQPGILQLKRWGLLQRLSATNCPRIHSMRLDFGNLVLEGTAPPADDVAESYAPRRLVLDALLVQAAREAGAEVREGFPVEELLFDDGRVTGVRGRGAEETARIVIGADGLNSIVAKSTSAPEYNARPALTCFYYSYWGGIHADRVELYIRPGRFIPVLPTHDGLTLVAVAFPHREFPIVRTDIEGEFFRSLDRISALAERVRGGRREDRFYGTAQLPNLFRKPWGPGWALAGDAGYHKDPVTARGITDSFIDAESLANAIEAGLGGRVPLDLAMEEHERRRDSDVMPMYELTCQLATLEAPPPEAQQLLASLAGNQPDTDRYIGTLAGTFPIPEFYSRENVQRIVTSAGKRASAGQGAI